MNDFFTELDADLIDVNTSPDSPKKSRTEPKECPPNTESICKAPINPTHKKQEPREVRKKGGEREDGISHFSENSVLPGIFPQSKPQSLPILPN